MPWVSDKMNETEFNHLVDELLLDLEEQLDEVEADIDYEVSGGILTISFENASQVIVNRQAPLKQVWVAAKSGGFHLDHDESADKWVCKSTGEELRALMGRVCSEQSGETILFN